MKLIRLLALPLALLVLALSPGLPSAAAQAPDAETARLEGWYKTYLEKVMREEPMTATRLGDHRFDDRLEELSAAARTARLERDRTALAALAKAI
ncbi:MAG: hypothetical protein ACKO0V_12210, partial [bacterium]